MRRLLESYLHEYITDEMICEEFDYNFDETLNEIILKEFKKFLRVYSTVFFDKEKFVTIINSYDFVIPFKDLEHLFKVYDCLEKNNLNKEKIIMLDFFVSYFQSINSQAFKKSCKDYKKFKNEFNTIASKNNFIKRLYQGVNNVLYKFYKVLIKYSIANDIYIDGEIIFRIFKNLAFIKINYDDLIEVFIKNNSSLANIIVFDTNKEKHLEIYIKEIIDSIKNFGGYDMSKEILLELEKSQVLNKKVLNKIVNAYINKINELCTNLFKKEESTIMEISKVETIKNEINFVVKEINTLSDKQKEKLRECLVLLFSVKRYLLKDDDYIKRDMHESEFEIKIEKEKVDLMVNKLTENVYSLYSASKFDFCNELETALEMYAKFPLSSHVTRYQFDSDLQMYAVNSEEVNNTLDVNIRRKFNELGKIYTENNKDKLLNILNGNYYEELLKYLSKTFIMKQQIIIATLKEEKFYMIIKKLRKMFKDLPDNDYAIIVNNVLAIEYHLKSIAVNKGLVPSKDGLINLNNIFDLYKEDKECVNGLMYLNYVLYEKSGMNLRNNILHGNLFGVDLKIQLLVTFSGLIFISWLLNER